jgi:putative chitinase
MKRIAPEWFDILLHCGVRHGTAETWCEIFAAVIGDDSFSAGDVDLRNFLGQVLHESSMLERLEEGLSYSEQRLREIGSQARIGTRWYLAGQNAMALARNPRELANFVYGGRMGNVDPDDGWKYRGRGLIQCTGRANYALVESVTGLPVLDQPELLAQPMEALQSAVAWWERAISDAILSDVERVSRAVNGGTAGLPDRIALTERAAEALA